MDGNGRGTFNVINFYVYIRFSHNYLMQKAYLPLFFSTLISSMYISTSKAASGGGMLIELAANERAVHGDFFNSKNFMPVVYPSFSMMMQLTFTSHPFFYSVSV